MEIDLGKVFVVLIILGVCGGVYLCYRSYTHPFMGYTVSGKLVTIDTDWFGTSFTIQQTITDNWEYNVGRNSGVDIDYSMIGKNVILHYSPKGDSYIKLLEDT
ncbi:MAG: hypothetical protein FWD52_04690 [Candidatus Bathyarchaeota archaeon]|nr:hypothetical protein [Candidatus Termiticorpusculum sp.]